MTSRWSGGPSPALRAFVVSVALALPAAAQSSDADAGDPGECTASPAPHDECPERCPSYDTCFIAGEGEPSLYYRVERERIGCDGLDCTAASVQLADYCCRRGEFAPSSGEGCGCVLGGAAAAAHPAGALGASLALALLLYRRRPRRGRQDPPTP